MSDGNVEEPASEDGSGSRPALTSAATREARGVKPCSGRSGASNAGARGPTFDVVPRWGRWYGMICEQRKTRTL